MQSQRGPARNGNACPFLQIRLLQRGFKFLALALLSIRLALVVKAVAHKNPSR
jgi:hypothetical protein